MGEIGVVEWFVCTGERVERVNPACTTSDPKHNDTHPERIMPIQNLIFGMEENPHLFYL